MKGRKLWALAAAVIVFAVVALSLWVRLVVSPSDGGPLDARPRLEASAVNPDRGLTVEVMRQRDPSYSIVLGADVFMQVRDSRGKVVYRRKIAHDGAWDELDARYRVTFEPDEIRVQPYDCRGGCSGAYHTIRLGELSAE